MKIQKVVHRGGFFKADEPEEIKAGRVEITFIPSTAGEEGRTLTVPVERVESVTIHEDYGNEGVLVASSEQIEAARAWAADCEWLDYDELEEMSDVQIIAGINRHYDGGWNQFIKDGNP